MLRYVVKLVVFAFTFQLKEFNNCINPLDPILLTSRSLYISENTLLPNAVLNSHFSKRYGCIGKFLTTLSKIASILTTILAFLVGQYRTKGQNKTIRYN